MHVVASILAPSILALSLTMALSGPALSVPEFDKKETAAFIQEEADQDRFSGTVLVAKDGVPIFTAAHGYANLDHQVPNQLDTKFNLGSMNKMFTAVAVAQLVEADRLSFDDTIIEHIPDYPNQDVAQKVTVHQLLTHTSGMANYWTQEYMRTSKDRFRAVADYLPLFVDQPLLFEPGSQYSYSNSGFMVLGLIIEHVSGQSYFDYVREHIYEPAGMLNTDAYELDTVVPNHAVGYTMRGSRDGELRNNLYLHVVKGGPAGGGYSTVEDLLRFSNALLGYKLLSKEMTKLVMEGKHGTNAANRIYGYGFRNLLENDHRVVGHSGGFAGINSFLDMYIDLGYTLAVMSNRDMGATAVRDHILAQLIGKTQWMRDQELTDAIQEEIVQSGYDAGVALYEKRKDEGTISERQFNRFGYTLLSEEKISQAIDIFRFNVFLYPESANTFDSLGEAYMVAGDKEKASYNYEKSLELDPDNQNAAEMLKRLRE
jgi:CubicO group peptidase (beta-lactamase class C family)